MHMPLIELSLSEAQPQIPVKDKSIWRKSNLNLPNAADEAEQDARKLRRQRSRGNMEQINASNLMYVKEEEKRKGLISALSQVPVQDRLTLYLRRPSEDKNFYRSGSLRAPKKIDVVSNSGSIPSSPIMTRSSLLRKYRYGSNVSEDANDDRTLPPYVPRRIQKTKDEDDVISDKIEIDSDNIETPPATRRKFGKMREFSSSLEDEPRRLEPIETSQEFESPPEEGDRVSPEGRSDKEMMNERGSLLRNSQRLRDIARRNEEEEVLGDGQFDRFSSTRRTRRYKKSVDSGPDVTEKENDENNSTLAGDQMSRPSPTQPTPQELTSSTTVHVDDKEARLKKWQNRLKYHGTAVQNEDTRLAQEAITDINKFGSELKNIDQMNQANPKKSEQSYKGGNNLNDGKRLQRGQSLQESRRGSMSRSNNNNNNNDTKADIKSTNNQIDEIYLNNDKSDFIPEIRVQANTPACLKTKPEQHELNDEGFEETQSLGSETPSQGTSSGCNYEQDSVDSHGLIRDNNNKKRSGKLNRADSSGSGDTNTSSSTNPPVKKFIRNSNATRSLMTPTRVGTLMQKLHRSDLRSNNRLDRSNSLKVSQKQGGAEERKILLSKYSNLRKTDSQSSLSGNKGLNGQMKRRGVERSNSRTSLRSSRSSLNSSTSVNTVRNVSSKSSASVQSVPHNEKSTTTATRRLAGYTTAIKNLTNNLKKESADKQNFGYKKSSGSQPTSEDRKKPLGQVQLRNSIEKIKTNVPASRSSSSGSSIGPTARRPKSSTLNTSFKENQSIKESKGGIGGGGGGGGSTGGGGPQSRSSSTGSITSELKPKMTKLTTGLSSSSKQKENNNYGNTGIKIPRTTGIGGGLNFMKPTAASSAKEPEIVINKFRPMGKATIK